MASRAARAASLTSALFASTEIIQASLPPGYSRPTAVAIDGTDVESHTRPRKKRIGSDGGTFWSVDHDARWGHRTATGRRPTETFLGYEGHVATYIPAVGAHPIPQLAAGLALRPGIRGRAGAALAILNALPRTTRASSTAATPPPEATNWPGSCANATSESPWTCARPNEEDDLARSPARSGWTGTSTPPAYPNDSGISSHPHCR